METVEARREERKQQRAKQSDEARHAKEALVVEAEELAQCDQWRSAGERLRALVDTWKGLPRLDRKSDDELWHRFSHARSAFSKRRKAHFASLDAQREEARKAKERLVAEAEALSGSTDWGPTAARYRELMTEWKAAGRAQREHEDDLWNRFRGAQDVFFAARSSVFAERDAEQTENLKLKEELAEEAEKLLPIEGPEGGPCRVPFDQRALGGHRPRAAGRPAEGRGPDARGRAGPPGVRGDRVAPDEPGGTRACRGSDRPAPGRRGQADGPDRAGARRRATTPGPTSSSGSWRAARRCWTRR